MSVPIVSPRPAIKKAMDIFILKKVGVDYVSTSPQTMTKV